MNQLKSILISHKNISNDKSIQSVILTNSIALHCQTLKVILQYSCLYIPIWNIYESMSGEFFFCFALWKTIAHPMT